MKRGQILTYDAIGGVVIFLIAVGILLTTGPHQLPHIQEIQF